MHKRIDLRSDTFTQPSIKMKEYMFDAPLGDDVYGEDPSVNALEEKMAKLTNKEDALFTSSGTQANLLALMAHCQRGDEYICGQEAHIYKYEAGGASVLGSIQPQPLAYKEDATFDLQEVKHNIKPDDSHFARTKLLCIENTHDGKVLPMKYLQEVNDFALENKLSVHLDGARVFNAAVALDADISQISQYVDSMSMCLSKGLGAPVGSVLVGSQELIHEARRYRKMVGGGLRQAGMLAAAGRYALDHHIADLKKDHLRALELKNELEKIKEVQIISSDTNMVFIKVDKRYEEKLLRFLNERNIFISGYSKLRLVTHRDISKEDIQTVIKAFEEFFDK